MVKLFQIILIHILLIKIWKMKINNFYPDMDLFKLMKDKNIYLLYTNGKCHFNCYFFFIFYKY